MVELVLGALMLMVGGGLLQEVPLPKFLAAYILIVLGSDLFNTGFRALQ